MLVSAVTVEVVREHPDPKRFRPPERCLQPDYEFRVQHIRDVTSVAIRAAKFLLLSRRFRKSVGEIFHHRMFQMTFEKRGNDQGTLCVPDRSIDSLCAPCSSS